MQGWVKIDGVKNLLYYQYEDNVPTGGIKEEEIQAMLEKRDLEMIAEVVREEIQGVRAELKEEVQGVRAELKEDIQGVKAELKEDIQGVRAKLKEDIHGVKAELKEKIQGVKAELQEIKKTADKALEVASKTQLLLENDISKKINIVEEGHHFLWLRLEEARRMDKRWEQMELELINLRMEFKEMKHVNIV